jgi:N-acetylmuramoyl-L-alanine amidase
LYFLNINLQGDDKMKICIDPGHGGYDPGAIGPSGLKESHVTLSIALKLREKLQLQGIQVVMTREWDTALGDNINADLNNRVQFANRNNSDYFISVHCNSSVNHSSKGTETYCYKFGGNGEKLARAIQSKLIGVTGLTNRGVKEGNFAVLRNTVMPAVLIETAFISNPAEEGRLADDSWRDKSAEAIAVGVCNYLGIEYKKEVNQVNEHWAHKYYEYLKDKGIDISETRFDDSVTRGELFVLLARILGYKE